MRPGRRCTPLILAGVLAVLAPAMARADGQITDCADTAGLRDAIAAGGAYTFACDGTIRFGSLEAEIPVTRDVSIDAGRHVVTIDGHARAGRIFHVASGHLTLGAPSGSLVVTWGSIVAPAGSPGAAGTNGANGPDGSQPGADGGAGTAGTAGQDAPAVAPGPVPGGGCMLVDAGAALTLQRGVTVTNCRVTGGAGGRGGDGGAGGYGGTGATSSSPGTGGGSGAAGGGAGAGAAGGEGLGGAIYNAGTLAVNGVRFGANSATGGDGGSGGAGGPGGSGGDAGSFSGVRNGTGGPAGASGSAGAGGAGGAGRGGAIYDVGSLSVVAAQFSDNAATGGTGGYGAGGTPGSSGGNGGGHQGGTGPRGGDGGSGGAGGNGGANGNGGGGRGAGIYSASATPAAVDTTTTFTGSDVEPGHTSPFGPGSAGPGGRGGYGGSGMPHGDDGAPGASGQPGVQGQGGVTGDPDLNVGRSYAVSGSVYDVNCLGSTCSRTGLPGVPVALDGTTSDGRAVKRAATTQTDGSWAVVVPSGSYRAGPAPDGSTIDGTGFDPTQRPVAVGAGPVGNVDFSACAVGGSGAAARSASAWEAPGVLTSLPRSVSAAAATDCMSFYTVDVSAKIPQKILVDPSLQAHYNTSSDPNHRGYSHFRGLIHYARDKLKSALHFATPFPACFSDGTVRRLTKQDAEIEWYTHIKGGALGGVKSTIAWNRKIGLAFVASGPTASYAKLTRVYTWRMTPHDKGPRDRRVTTGHCADDVEVPVLSLPVGGADAGSKGPGDNEFTIITTWGFPFDAAGEKIDPEGTLVQRAYKPVEYFDEAVQALARKIWIRYKHAPEAERFLVDFTVAYVLGKGAGKILTSVAPRAVEAFLAESKYLPAVQGNIKKLAEVYEYVHVAKALSEVLGFIGAYDGEYPVMSTVLRGSFTTKYVGGDHPLLVAGKKIPTSSTLALSARSTKFPTMSVKVSRTAAANPNTTVYNGALPWRTGVITNLLTSNAFGHNAPYVIADGAGREYSSGKEAVEKLHEATSQNKELAESVADHEELITNLTREQDEAPEPSCADGLHRNRSSICWTFTDGRP